MHLGSSETTTFDKLESNFHINDKNRELKEKYGGLKDSFLHYESDNYRRGTQSHIKKRSKIIKKEAYDKVFGPDISSMSRTNGFERKSVTFDTPPRPKSISLTSPFQENSTHKNLRNLIHKMHDYKNKLSETNDVLKMAESSGHNPHGEDHMVGLIKNMGKLYQERTINQG